MSRCIPIVMDEGRDQKQAAAICYSMYEKKEKGMLEKVKEFIENLMRKEDEPPAPSSAFFTKQVGDRVRWTAVWSNKYRDDDNPPEIIAEKAHLDYVNAVQKEKSYPYPQLWLWHYPNSKWGETDLVAYDPDRGMSIASGLVDKGMEPIVEALNSKGDIAVSHSMPKKEIERDPEDESVITRYRSVEISPLPTFAAANKLTSFVIGGTMEPKGTKEQLKEWLGDKWDEFEGLLDGLGEKAELSGKEFKEKTETEEPVEDKSETTEEPEVKAEDAEDTESEPESKEAPEPEYASRDEVLEAVSKMSEVVGEAVKEMAGEIASLKERLSEFEKSEEERLTEKAATTPSLSWADMVASAIATRGNLSAIGKDETRVDGRTKEAQGPKETEAPEKPMSGNAMVNGAISNIAQMWDKSMTLGAPLGGKE